MAILDPDEANATATAIDPGVGITPHLYNGQRLDQPTFHALYEPLPESFRAELIEGVVHIMHAVHARHGQPHADWIWLIKSYAIETPGCQVTNDTTVQLDPMNEVQPDGALWVEPRFGGQIRYDAKGYFLGSPELVIEIASSSLAVDMGAKKDVYERSNALEYVVFDEPNQLIRWFLKIDGRSSRPCPSTPTESIAPELSPACGSTSKRSSMGISGRFWRD